jgi:hypothetical protein
VQRGVAERVDSRRIRAAAEQVRRDVHVAVVRRVPAAVWRAWAVRTYRYRVGPLCHSCSERYVVGRCDILPAVQAPSPSARPRAETGLCGSRLSRIGRRLSTAMCDWTRSDSIGFG